MDKRLQIGKGAEFRETNFHEKGENLRNLRKLIRLKYLYYKKFPHNSNNNIL